LPTRAQWRVIPAAQYRHFSSRPTRRVLSGIAQRGLRAIRGDVWPIAWYDGAPDKTGTAFRNASSRPMLPFARDDPAFHSAMFRNRASRRSYPALQAASERVSCIVMAVLRSVLPRWPVRPSVPRQPAMMMALHILGRCRNCVASLFARGDGRVASWPMSREDLSGSAGAYLLRGLRFLTDQ